MLIHLLHLLAKILAQIENAVKPITVEIISRPKPKDTKEAPNDALPRFLAIYTTTQKVGVLLKETPSGKLVSEWQALLDGAATKPDLIDMTPAISALLATKDEDELVGSPLPSHYIFAEHSLEIDTNSCCTDLNSAQVSRRTQVGVNS